MTILLICTAPSAFAQTISVQTDSSGYEEGDTIVISGEVSTVLDDTTPVVLQIFYERNLMQVGQVNVAQDGSYSHIIATGSTWNQDGQYTVRVTYGDGQSDTQFDYYLNTSAPETTEIFEVEDGDSGTFDVKYTIRGGMVRDMLVDKDNFALKIAIEASDDGTILLDLPRSAIDATEQNGDIDFIVLIDEIPASYEEPKKDLGSRVITIPFVSGDSEIMIIGTYIIPEFGPAAITVLIAVTAGVVLLTKSMSRRII